MKNIKNKLVVLLCVVFAFPCFVVAQGNSTSEVPYEVSKVFPPLSMSKEKLLSAHTLMDLNSVYESSWIKEFIAVEISATNNGKLMKVVHKNDTITEEQRAIMKMADEATEISVKVKYMPENTLKHNDPKEYNFSFLVNPDNEATYVGGEKELKKYLKNSVIDKIPADLLEGYEFAAVKFTVSEEGEILNPHLSWPTKDENVDKLLLESVRKMPCWKPAEYTSGLKVKQDFAFMVGNMESCVVNVLNVRQFDREEKNQKDAEAKFPEAFKAMETFDVQFQIEQLENDQYYLLATIDMDRGSYVISPLSTDDFYLHFDISLDENKNLVEDKVLLETPQSLPEIDPVLNIPVNFVREKTTYKKKLEVVSKDDFAIKGNVIFLLEPICIPYQVDFVISNQNGKLKVKNVRTKIESSYKGR